MKNIIYIFTFVSLLLSSCSVKKGTTTSEKTGTTMDNDPKFRAMFHDANKYLSVGDYERAFNAFQDCIDLNAKCDACHYQMSALFDFQSRFTSAIESANTAVELDPENEWYLTQLAYLYKRNGMYSESLETFKKLTKQFPNNSEYYFALAEANLYMGKNQEAINAFDEAEKIVGSSPELSLQKHRLYLDVGQPEKAIAELETLIEKYPSDVQFYGILAELYEQQKEEEKALKLYHKILEIDPDNGIVHLSLYEHYRFNGEDAKAKDELKKAIQSDDVLVDDKVRIIMGIFARSEGNLALRTEGYEYIEVIKASNPKEAKVYTIEGDFLYRDYKKKEAIKAYKKAVTLESDKFEVWNRIMIIESEIKDYKNLYFDSKTANELYPTQPGFYFFNGVAQIQLDSLEQAIEILTIGKDYVLDNNAFLAEFYQQLAEAHHLAKNNAESDKNFDKCLDLNSQNPFVLNNYAYYLSVRNERLDLAEAMSKRSNELQEGSSSFQDTYGWILFQKNNYPDAQVWLEKALNSGGNEDGTVLEHYGDLMFKRGKESTALEYWIKAKAAGGATDQIDKKIETKSYHE